MTAAVPRGTDDQARADLLWIASDFRHIVDDARTGELSLPSNGTRWTNRQLLFHMVLGQNIALTSVWLFGMFSRLPPGASRAWSGMLARCTRPYNWVNWAGAVVGARVLAPGSMARMMDRSTAALVHRLDRAAPVDLARGMSVPPSWDPYFFEWMDRRDILEWAPKHYRHHRAQLSLRNLPA